jgi:glucokinase
MPNRKDYFVGVDLGGTSVRAVVADTDYKILAAEKSRTHPTDKPRVAIAAIAGLIQGVIQSAGVRRTDIRAALVGAPGAVDPRRGIVKEAPNLGWTDIPLAAELRNVVRVPVMVDNDVNVGVVGEHALGAGKGAKNLVGIFVGTGIGGAILIDGKLFEGSRGAAGEIGHTVLLVGGPLCSCGHRGCAEALASRTAMERDVRAAIRSGRKSVVLKIMKKKKRPRMTSSVIAAALKKKDPVMRDVLKRAESYLGILAANAVNLLDPDCIVIGGGIAERLGDDFVGPIRETARRYFLHGGESRGVRIVPGKLGDEAGSLGAVVLARQRLGL